MYHKWEMLERIHYICEQRMGCDGCAMCKLCPYESGNPIKTIYNYTNEQLKLIDDEYVRLKNQTGEIAFSMETQEMISKAVDENMAEATKAMKELTISANPKQVGDNFEYTNFVFDGRGKFSGADQLNELFGMGWSIDTSEHFAMNQMEFIHFHLKREK